MYQPASSANQGMLSSPTIKGNSGSPSYVDLPQLGCSVDLRTAPLNVGKSVVFKNFSLNAHFAMVNDVWFKLNRVGLYEINSDFGRVSLDGRLYNLHKLTFLSTSETQIAGKVYPLEVQIEGKSKHGKKLIISALFKKTLVANPILMKLGIGVGLLKAIGQQARSRSKKIKYRFSLDSLFRGSKEFLRFQGSSTHYPCDEAEWLVLHHSLPINAIQLEEFPKITRYSTKQLSAGQSIVQNFDPQLSTLSEFDEISIRKTKIFTNVVLDNRFPNLQFSPSPPIKPKVKAPKIRSLPTAAEIANEKRMKRARELMFSPFKIYQPTAGQPWGVVPPIAVMPWEMKVHEKDKDKFFFPYENIKVASPKKGYHYIPLYYGPTGAANIVDKKLAFVPYLILVKNKQKPLNVPTLGVNVWHIELQRDFFMRIRHTFGKQSKLSIDRKLAGKIYGHKKPVTKPKKKPIDKYAYYDKHRQFVKNQTRIIAAQEKLRKQIAQEVNLLERHNLTNSSSRHADSTESHSDTADSSSKPATRGPNGGYSEAVVNKKLSPTEEKLEFLDKLVDESFEKDAVAPAIEFVTPTFPLISLDPGRYPSDAVLVNHKLPNNSVILNLKVPPAPAARSKYLPLFFGPTEIRTRRGQSVWVPNYVLVPDYLNMPMELDQLMPNKLAAYINKDPYWEDYEVKIFDIAQTPLMYNESLVERGVLVPPYHEKGHYISQEVFNKLVERKTKKPRTMRAILIKNKKRIQDMLDTLGQAEERDVTIPRGQAMLEKTGTRIFDKDGRVVVNQPELKL